MHKLLFLPVALALAFASVPAHATDVFALLGIIGKYPDVTKEVTNDLPELEQLGNGAGALYQNHKPMIDRLQTLTPRIQALMKDLQPIISPPQNQADGAKAPGKKICWPTCCTDDPFSDCGGH